MKALGVTLLIQILANVGGWRPSLKMWPRLLKGGVCVLDVSHSI